MHKRNWTLAAVIGWLTGIVVAAAMSIADWRLNPGGIFRDELGTDWAVVMETALSWLWPVALAAFAGTVIVLFAIAWIRGR